MIEARFRCGHTVKLTGKEQTPRCACGEARIEHVNAPAPRFVGCVLGPCAEYKDLPAKAVVLKKEETNG